MSQQQGQLAIMRFFKLLVLIVVVSGSVAYLADLIQRGHHKEEVQPRNDDVSARIAPIGAVATDAISESSDATAEPEVIVQTVVEKPPFDAEAAYKSVCFVCHDTGAADAPKLDAASWVDRLPKGEDVLNANAINGIGLMPPKGGRMSLSDEEVAAIVGYMLSKAQE